MLLAKALRLEDATLRYLDLARRPSWLTVGRPDVVLLGDRFAMVEPNAGTSCGFVADADVLGRIFEQSPVIGDFLQQAGARRVDVVAALVAYLRDRLQAAGKSATGRVTVVEFAADLDRNSGLYELLADQLRRYGLPADVAAVEDLDADESGVAHSGRRCDLLYRFAAEEPDPVGHFDLLAPLLRASRSDRVVIVDELDDAIAANKTILATLSEQLDAGWFPPALGTVLTAFLPWTRVLEQSFTSAPDGRRVDLPAWTLSHQDDLVLKPGAGFCGRGVTIGCEATRAGWQEAVEHALDSAEAWLVQRLAASRPTRSSIIRDRQLLSERTFVDYGYFVVGGKAPVGIIRKNSPFDTHTRRVKLAATGPVFLV